MRMLFHEENYHGVPLLGVINVGLEVLRHWAESWEPIFKALLPLAQLVVAVCSVIYIIRKTKLLGKKK